MLPSVAAQTHLSPGSRLDQRYELLAPMAQGGMAVVWVARVVGKLGLEKLYAVKTILPHLYGDPSFRAMFLDEAKIASRIRHPNVVSLEDLGEDDGQLYMVLEWVQGESLSRLHSETEARGTAIPPNLLLRILADACAGLHAAHELPGDDGRLLNVVHRDISPQNILVTTAGVTKVIDFGIATALDRLAEKTRKGLMKGKIEYAAPEQVRMKHPIDRRADIWALGTILYQYLAGRLPFTGERDLDIVEALVSGAPPPPLPPHIPPQLANVAMTALRPRREERFSTALDMQRALEGCLTEPTTTTDVATFLQEHLSSRLESRRREIAEAVRASDERAGSAYRPRLASIPELLPFGDGVITPEKTDLPSLATTETQVTPLERDHWIAMICAVVITVAVWSAILFVLSGGMARGR